MTAVQGLLWPLPDVDVHHSTVKRSRVESVTTPVKHAWQRIIVARYHAKLPTELGLALLKRRSIRTRLA